MAVLRNVLALAEGPEQAGKDENQHSSGGEYGLPTEDSLDGEVGASRPRHSNTDQASENREDNNKPPPDIKTPQSADQPAEKKQICQFDGEDNEPPQRACGVFQL